MRPNTGIRVRGITSFVVMAGYPVLPVRSLMSSVCSVTETGPDGGIGAGRRINRGCFRGRRRSGVIF